MNYQCFLCSQNFEAQKNAIAHLKLEHYLVDNSSPIQCIVEECQNTYLSFKALNLHLKKCHQKDQMVGVSKFHLISKSVV